MQFPWRKKTELSVVPVAEPVGETVPRGELETLQAEIDADHQQLAQLEDEARQLGASLGEIAGAAAQLKVEASQGSPNACSALDALDDKQRSIERRHEGLRLRIGTLTSGLAPKLRRATELAQIRDAERQDQAIADLKARTDAMTAELLHHWRASCGIGFDLMKLLDGAIGAPTLDAEHRRQALTLNTAIGKQLLAASVANANEHWRFARADSFHSLRIIPGKPRTEIERAG
jgi:hypothetical protein